MSTAQYQACRWYDPYPRLAFALKLLYFAPQHKQIALAKEINVYLDQILGKRASLMKQRQRHFEPSALEKSFTRWYDRDQELQTVVERLKALPDTLKNAVADRVIAKLTQQSMALT